MPKFKVGCDIRTTFYRIAEAESEEEAMDKAFPETEEIILSDLLGASEVEPLEVDDVWVDDIAVLE